MIKDRKMKVQFISGISCDRVQVKIQEGDKYIFQEDYEYGYNASHSRAFAEIAERDHENAIKYGWRGIYPLKPFIGDILRNIIEDNLIGNNDLEYSGYNVFAGRSMTAEEVQKLVDKIADEV